MTMTKAETLAELITRNRGFKRTISYLEAENSERVVGYDELYERALGILFHLQKLGAKPGDKLIIYLANNEQFLDAFWAGMLGGIVPVPVALGISDEHKHKLLRIAKKLGKPFIYTDRKALDRGRRQSHLDATDPRHGPDRHAHHDVRASHAAERHADGALHPPPAAVDDIRIAQGCHRHELAELRLSALPQG